MALREPLRLYDYRGHRKTVAPSVEPITVRELKLALRLSSDAEDEFLAQLILDAVSEIEEITGLALITQSWQLTLDRWPTAREPWWDGVRQGSISDLHGARYASDVMLPRYPLQSITSCTVYDENSVSTAVTVASTFDVDTQSFPGRMSLQVGAAWPVALRANNAIEIVYAAGYGDTPEEVPDGIKRAVRQMAAYAYAHRGDGCDMGDAYAKSGAAGIVERYRAVAI